ncbi:MAG TPA: histidinol-phosphate transaminase [Balneolales bacterium]|nr:histidinol-phosphate transaminase [Balneolales bacterium]
MEKQQKVEKQSLNLEKLVRPNILALSPYHCARDDYESGLLLDANENAFGPAVENKDKLNRYPSPRQEKLRSLIADFRSVEMEQVFVGVGSDEAIDLLIRIFCNPGKDSILITPPTYGMYQVAADINDIKVISVPLTASFQLQTDQILQSLTDQTKIIFLCSPNNPTGNNLNRNDIKTILTQFNGIVVVDEAYIDFSEMESLASQIDTYPNLVVLQTLSKSFGLAGIRLGLAITSEEIINLMMKVKAPYNINQLTSETAIQALQNIGKMKNTVKQIIEERERVRKELEKIDTVHIIHPSDTNFILFEIERALEVYQELAESGVIVRYRGGQIHCDNCIRVTIGRPEENDRFLSQLKKTVS